MSAQFELYWEATQLIDSRPKFWGCLSVRNDHLRSFFAKIAGQGLPLPGEAHDHNPLIPPITLQQLTRPYAPVSDRFEQPRARRSSSDAA